MSWTKAEETAYVFMIDSIDAQPASLLIDAITAKFGTGIRHLYIVMNTNGGSVPHGFALYNFLKALPYDITMHNIGNVDSIGNVVFLAGSRRYASANATFMLHPVKSELKTTQVEISTLKEKLSSLETDEARIKNLFTRHSTIADEELNRVFATGEVKNADEALRLGLIHEIRELAVDPASPVIVLKAGK